MQIYSIKNEKLNFFNRPVYVETPNEAINYIQNILMSDADRALHGLKDDLALYYLGDIDFVEGKIDPLKKPKLICNLNVIFETIPDDRIPQTANQLREMIEKVCSEVNILFDRYSDLNAAINANCEVYDE